MRCLPRPVRLLRARGAAPSTSTRTSTRGTGIVRAAAASRGIVSASPRSWFGSDKSAPPPRPVEDSDLLGLVRTGLHPLSLADLVK